MPLHPIVVHFPLVLAVCLPIVAAVLWFARARDRVTPRAWWVLTVVAGGAALGAWASVRTGEMEEDRVERVVREAAIHDHEERAEALMWGSAGYFALTLLLPVIGAGRGRRLAGIAAVAGGLAVGALAVPAGHTGGKLVYEFGAAQAYAGGGLVPESRGDRARIDREHEDDAHR